jgi:hypothetical protein
MQTNAVDKTGFTPTVCPECGARGAVDVKFGIVSIHCKAGHDFQVSILPAWLQQEMNGQEQRKRAKAAVPPGTASTAHQ